MCVYNILVTEMDLLLLIDKPIGPTSFAVLKDLRRLYAEQTGLPAPKMGHAGTLDPLASGLLLVGVGPGTKQLKNYVGLNKEYLADVMLGEDRTTDDLEGDIVRQKEVGSVTTAEATAVLSALVGTQRLPVPAYSAVKRGGVPLYKKARLAAKSGATIKTPPRDMDIYQSELLAPPQRKGQRVILKVRFLVSSGTYIRSLAVEVGRRLGYPATLAGLRRLKVGEFSVTDATVPEAVKFKSLS